MRTKLPPSQCRNTDSQEYPMHPECFQVFVLAAATIDPLATNNATAVFFTEVAEAQQNYIDALKLILPKQDFLK
jgi:hypothetical protein